MPPDPKDDVLEQAALSEERLRRLLAARSSAPIVTPTTQPSPEPEVALEGDLVPDVLYELEDPDGHVAWALRTAPASARPEIVETAGFSVATVVLDGLARAAPIVAQALRQRQVFEMIGSSAALEGLRNGTLELIPAKTGGFIGGIRAGGGTKILHQARFQRVKLTSAIGPHVAFAVVSAIVGQMHLAAIQEQLAKLNAKLARVLEGQQAERHGRLAAAVEVLSDVAATFRASGTVTPSTFQRLVAAEANLRTTHHELVRLHHDYARHTEALIEADLGAFDDAFASTRAAELHDAWLLLTSTAALVEVERLLCAHALEYEPAAAAERRRGLDDEAARVEQLLATVAHLEQYENHCRGALERKQAEVIRFRTAQSERVSAFLREDHRALAEFHAQSRRALEGQAIARGFQVLRVDARGSEVRVRGVVMVEGRDAQGDGRASHLFPAGTC